jgi:hypothetical protein
MKEPLGMLLYGMRQTFKYIEKCNTPQDTHTGSDKMYHAHTRTPACIKGGSNESERISFISEPYT